MNPKKKIGKKEPKKVDLFDDTDPFLSPFHKMKMGSYLNKKGEWKNYAIFRKKTDDELFNEEKGVAIKKQEKNISDSFKIEVKDREIWVNDYLIGKPHAVGSNLEFFEHIRSQSANTKIERNKLPDFGGSCLKKDIQNKGFIKILNELGFKDEILKAFFPKRGKNMLAYRGDKITKKDLEKAGIKMSLFIKELELAHLKSSPE